MTIALQSRATAHVARNFKASDGHGRPRVQEPPAYLRRAPSGIDDILRAASPANVVSMLGQTQLPDAFTPSQMHVVRFLIDKHNAQSLAQSPVIDSNGHPLPLQLASPPLSDVLSGDVIPVAGQLESNLVGLLANYQENLRWQQDNIGIRTILPGEAEPALTGQEGVFAKKDIDEGTVVGFFGGQLLADPQAIALDEKVRTMAGIYSGKYLDFQVSKEGPVLQGMSTFMKCNSGGENSNVFAFHVNTIDPNGQKVSLRALIAAAPIKAGQELRMCY